MHELDIERGEERLPPTARVYLSVWSMGVAPGTGRRLTVTTAARLAGVTKAAVQRWRERHPGFREMEKQARDYDSGYTAQLARRIVESLVLPAGGVLAKAIEDNDVRLAWEIIKAAGGIEAVIAVTGQSRLAAILEDLKEDGEMADGEAESETV